MQGLSGNVTAAAKNLTRVEAALERETSALRSGLHSVQQISAHLKGQVSEAGRIIGDNNKMRWRFRFIGAL